MKIYMPVNSVNDFSCYVIYDSETIRAFVDNPHIGQNAYTDFYINSCKDIIIKGYEYANLKILDVGKTDTIKEAELLLPQLL